MSRVLTYEIPPACGGMTLRDFARHRLGFSAGALARQKREPEGILVNGVPRTAAHVLRTGEVLSFRLPQEQPSPVLPIPLPLSVLWESEDYLAVDKPPDMPVHPSPGHDRDSLLNGAAWYFQERREAVRPRPLYRLDKDTSGIVLLAKHRVAALAVLEKTYYAVCQGELSGAGIITLPIGLEPGSKIKRQCGHGDPARTRWRALSHGDGCTLLACRLETGRTHQIRAHFSAIGYPLCGDDLYGGGRERLARQALHCGALTLRSAALGEERRLLCPFPADLLAAFPWLPKVQDCEKEAFPCQPV